MALYVFSRELIWRSISCRKPPDFPARDWHCNPTLLCWQTKYKALLCSSAMHIALTCTVIPSSSPCHSWKLLTFPLHQVCVCASLSLLAVCQLSMAVLSEGGLWPVRSIWQAVDKSVKSYLQILRCNKCFSQCWHWSADCLFIHSAILAQLAKLFI